MFCIELTGKSAWVTGASRGIGRAIALALAEAGANVAVGYHRNEAAAIEVVKQCIAKGVNALPVSINLSDLSHCEASYQNIKEKFGQVDILVNNAGIIKDDLFIMSEPGDWQDVFNANVFGLFKCTQIVAKDMLGQRNGRIINVTSAAGTKGGRGQAIYAASKGAIESMSRSLAVELGRKGVTVNCVAPGVIVTDMTTEIRKIASQEILDRQLIKRFGQPEEVASWVLLLASKYGEFVTGQTIHIDGGLKMS